MRKSILSVLVLILLLGSYVVTMGTICPIVSTAANDISDKISLIDLKLVKDTGGEVSEENKIHVDDIVQMNYTVKINQEKNDEIRSGDNFTVSLPDDHYFSSHENPPSLQLKDGTTNEIFGLGSLSKNYFTVTLNKQAASQTMLNNLKLTVKLKAIKAGNKINPGGNNFLNSSTLEIVDLRTPIDDLIQVVTKVEGVEALKDFKNFEYVLVDKSESINPIAYGITERKLSQKNDPVNVVFYKNKTAQGEYLDRIDGNTGAMGWSSLLKDNHSYLIREITNPSYSTVITGGAGEGDQYEYQIENTQTARFLILNRPIVKEQFSNDFVAVSALAIPQMRKEPQEKPAAKQKAKENAMKYQAAPASSSSASEEETKDEKGITLTKTDSSTGEKLQGAKFELKNAEGEELYLRKELITDENGKLHINPLPAGKYSLVEVGAPEGYQLDSDPLEFTFDKEDQFLALTKENTKEGKAAPVKKVFPKETETSQNASSEQTNESPSNSTKKQYPQTGMAENKFLLLLGGGLLAVVWIFLKKNS